MLPTNSDWNFMRSEVQKFMPDTVSIYSISTSYSSETGESKVRTLVSTVKAKIHDASGNEKRLLQTLVDVGTETIETARLDLPYGTTITTDYEVLTADGKYWNIHSTNASQTFTAETEALLYRKIVNGVVQNG